MELWIRNQDKKKILKVNYIYISEYDKGKKIYFVYGETIDSNVMLGKYKSKKRALEVLDEIENKINEIQEPPKTRIISEGERTKLISVTTNFVYQMPEE